MSTHVLLETPLDLACLNPKTMIAALSSSIVYWVCIQSKCGWSCGLQLINHLALAPESKHVGLLNSPGCGNWLTEGRHKEARSPFGFNEIKIGIPVAFVHRIQQSGRGQADPTHGRSWNRWNTRRQGKCASIIPEAELAKGQVILEHSTTKPVSWGSPIMESPSTPVVQPRNVPSIPCPKCTI